MTIAITITSTTITVVIGGTSARGPDPAFMRFFSMRRHCGCFSGGAGVSVAMWGSRLRSDPAALCLDELPESQDSRTTPAEVARACSEVHPCYQDNNVHATSPDMFICFKSHIVLSKQYLSYLGRLFMFHTMSRL